MPNNCFYRYLDTNGDGTGDIDASVDGSSTPVEFYIQPESGKTLFINRMIVYLRCGRAAFSADAYGDISALANGVNIDIRKVSDDTIINHLDGEIGICTNSCWGALCYDAEPDNYGTGDRSIRVRWSFFKAGRPLHLSDQEKLVVTINDNLSTLVAHKFMVQGWE